MPYFAEDTDFVENATIGQVGLGLARSKFSHALTRPAVLVTPAHQYPTGTVLGPARRAAVLECATKRRAIIIEDDYYAEYRYDR